jgi:hypothetical protein
MATQTGCSVCLTRTAIALIFLSYQIEPGSHFSEYDKEEICSPLPPLGWQGTELRRQKRAPGFNAGAPSEEAPVQGFSYNPAARMQRRLCRACFAPHGREMLWDH